MCGKKTNKRKTLPNVCTRAQRQLFCPDCCSICKNKQRVHARLVFQSCHPSRHPVKSTVLHISVFMSPDGPFKNFLSSQSNVNPLIHANPLPLAPFFFFFFSSSCFFPKSHDLNVSVCILCLSAGRTQCGRLPEDGMCQPHSSHQTLL